MLLLVAAACFLIAALAAAVAGFPLGPPLAWIAGGLSAWALSGVVTP